LEDFEAETPRTTSLDVGYAEGRWEANVTLFGANVDDATRLEDIAADRVCLVNIERRTRVRGSELLLRFRRGGFTVIGSYVFVDATEPCPDRGGRRAVPLTPKHTAGLVGMSEEHGRGRIEIEAYYTGRQALEDNPCRARSRPYLHLGVLGDIAFGRVSLFLNAENLLNVRQTATILCCCRSVPPAENGRWMPGRRWTAPPQIVCACASEAISGVEARREPAKQQTLRVGDLAMLDTSQTARPLLASLENIGGALRAMSPQPFLPVYIEAMRQVGYERSYPAGEIITPVGQRMDRFLLVLEGSSTSSSRSPERR
jgi:hypothetical protein